MKKNVIVLYGGKSVEHDISIITAIQTIANIDLTRYSVYPVYMKGGSFYNVQDYADIGSYISFDCKRYKEALISDGAMYILKNSKLTKCRRIDCAILCNHGGEGENGSLQGFLNVSGIAYTSADVLGSSIGMNKSIQKIIVEHEGICTARAMLINTSDYLSGKIDLEKIFADFKGKIIVKPVNLGSSIGITVVGNLIDFKKAVDLVSFYDSDALAEEFLEGVGEYNCTLYKTSNGVNFGKVEKVEKNHNFLTFNDKYIHEKGKGMVGQKREFAEGELAAEIKSISEKIYSALSLSGIVRMDYLVRDEKVYFNEVNTIPGSLSQYLYDEDFGDLLTKIIENAIFEKENRSKMTISFNSSLLNGYNGAKFRK